MFSSTHRFHGRGAIKQVFRSGRILRNRLFTTKYMFNTRRRSPRYAVVVSKKIAKSAVVRNRIRRRLYEALRQQLGNLYGPVDVVVIVTSVEVATISVEELTKAVRTIATQAGLNKPGEK